MGLYDADKQQTHNFWSAVHARRYGDTTADEVQAWRKVHVTTQWNRTNTNDAPAVHTQNKVNNNFKETRQIIYCKRIVFVFTDHSL